jgi:hypothetical protein
MTETAKPEVRIETIWKSFASPLAAMAGALTALISLLAEVHLATACMRGALTAFSVHFVIWLGAKALIRINPPEYVDVVYEQPAEQEPAA